MQRKLIPVVMLTTTLISSSAIASGYRIPEQSLNSTALSSAYVANAFNTDAAYYNPANMSWMGQGYSFEGGFTYIHLPSVTYTDNRSPTLNGESEGEHFIIPNFYMVSPDYNNFRFGFAVVFPAGLAKRWENPFPKTFAEKFSMTVMEANPTVSYKFGEMFSAAAGIRLLYSEATVQSQGAVTAAPAGSLGGGMPPTDEFTYITRDLEGDTAEFGYNVALTFKPVNNLNLAATYRSKVDLDMEGEGTLSALNSFPNSLIPGSIFQGTGTVSIPVPAILALAVSYTFEKATLEFEYDRTFWSDYETLDINYSSSLRHPVLIGAFDRPVTKNWEDVDAFRLGLTYKWDEKLTLMFGGGIDGNPVPDASLSFDVPDSDAWFGSLGFRYNYNEKWAFGAAYLYASKEDRSVVNSTLNGEFSDSSSHLLSLSAAFTF